MPESVISEPRVYAPDSPHSYFLDIFTVRNQRAANKAAAEKRLSQHHGEVLHHIEEGTKEGRRAERVLRSRARSDDPNAQDVRYGHLIRELRAFSTGGGATASAASGAAAFVSPYFAWEAAAMFRGKYPTFVQQCLNLPLPSYGMQAYIPAFTSTDQVAVQTEGSLIVETDPVTALQGGPVALVGGRLNLSQQLFDRGGSGGGTLDRFIELQLRQQLDEAVDAYAILQVIANGTPISDTTVSTGATLVDQFYADTDAARESLTDTAGTRLRATHIFTTSDLFGYITKQPDSNSRPIVTPATMPGLPPSPAVYDRDNAGLWAQFTGIVLPGGLYWFIDDNIPLASGNAQAIVSAPRDAVVVLQDEDAVLDVYPQTIAGNLQTVVILRKYVSVITRHAAGSAVISGAAYPSSNK